MWHKHMCSAWVQSLLKHTRKTQFYCLLCGVITPRHWSGGMLKTSERKRESEGEAATSCARQCQAKILEPYGHPEGGETCPV